jgi:F0F1-type ATP synthase assembly protein I
MNRPPRSDHFSALRSGGLLLAIPTLLIVAPLLGFFAGHWLDRFAHIAPWGAIVGLVLGLVTAGRETWKIYQRYLREEEESKRRR